MSEMKEPNDITCAKWLGVYIDCNADINRTYLALKKRVTKKMLKYLAERQRWDAAYLYAMNRFAYQVVEDALERKQEALRRLGIIQEKLYKSIIGYVDEESGEYIPPLPPKSLEHAVEALIRAMEFEKQYRGEDEGEGEKKHDGLLVLVQNIIQEAKKNGGDNDSDPLRIGEGLSRFEVRGEEADS